MKRSRELTRRDLLKQAALAAPALAGLPGLLAAAEPGPAAGEGRGPLKVVVVGAGLAGLAAAYELKVLGHDVTVLEAQMRPGGRVHTLREPFTGGLFAEAGAIDFSPSYRHLERYVELFKLPTVSLDNGPYDFIYHLRGKRLSIRWSDPKAKEPDWPFALSAEERRLGLNGMFQKYFEVVDRIGDPTVPGWRLDPWKEYDQITVAELLRRQGASNEAIELIGVCSPFGYGWSSGSALHRLLSDLALFYLPGQRTRLIEGGTDLLPKAFAAALGDRLRYGVPVVKILEESGKVRVVFRRGGTEEWLEADRVICAAPVPALRKVEFGPELPTARRRIFEQLEYTPVTRIYLQAKRRFWRDAGEHGVTQSDLPIQMVYQYPFSKAPTADSGGILECHLRGAEAERIARLDQPAQIAFALESLEKVYPGFKEHYQVGTSVAWSSDPWTGGGYAWWKPGQLTGWMPQLAEPLGRIHFAGEHTSLLGRTMEGAVESGNRAAREVHEAPRPAKPHAK